MQHRFSDPVESTRAARCRRLCENHKLPDAIDVMSGRISIDQSRNRYAVHWALFRYLMEPKWRDKTVRALKAACNIADDHRCDRVFECFQREFGVDGLAAIARGFPGYVAEFAPTWDVPWGDVSLAGRQWIQSSRHGVGVAWPPQSGSARISSLSGRFNVKTFGAEDGVYLLLRCGAARAIAVAFAGEAVLRAYDLSWNDEHQLESRWDFISKGPPLVDGVRSGSFRVEISDQAISVAVNGIVLLRLPVGERVLDGRWGIGVGPDAVVIWADVRAN